MNAYSKKLRRDGFAENAEIVFNVESADHGSGFTVERAGFSVTGSWGASKAGLPPFKRLTLDTGEHATEFAKGVVTAHISRFGFRE
jgi:hypothetical protein